MLVNEKPTLQALAARKRDLPPDNGRQSFRTLADKPFSILTFLLNSSECRAGRNLSGLEGCPKTTRVARCMLDLADSNAHLHVVRRAAGGCRRKGDRGVGCA